MTQVLRLFEALASIDHGRPQVDALGRQATAMHHLADRLRALQRSQ